MAENKTKQSAPEAMESLNKKEAFIVKYKNAIIAGVVVLVAVIAGGMIFKSCQNDKNEKAGTAIAAAQGQLVNTLGSEMYMPDSLLNVQYELMLSGNDSAAVVGFKKIADEYGSTKTGNLANLYAGLCYASMNKWKEAAEYLEKFDGCDDQMVSPAAKAALGNAYANLNQLDKAVETLKKAADEADNVTVSPQALIQAGEILESQNKAAEALELYKKAQTYIDRLPANAQQQMNRLNIDAYIERASQK